jgi:hypothetical protein
MAQGTYVHMVSLQVSRYLPACLHSCSRASPPKSVYGESSGWGSVWLFARRYDCVFLCDGRCMASSQEQQLGGECVGILITLRSLITSVGP